MAVTNDTVLNSGTMFTLILHSTIKVMKVRSLFFALFGFLLLSSAPVHSKEFESSIKITSPNSSTVWTIPHPVELKWATQNIATSKTIQFYLLKGVMVVQELGIFENNTFKNDIKINKTLAAGNDYRVMGIELFPDDKYSIAKYATSFFTIVKATDSKENQLKTSEKNPETARDMFDGRQINYVDELVVASDEIRINLWDHGRQDGDIVSIYLNGEALVSKYYLTYHKKSFNIKLDANKPNDLFLYAHNLGKTPPNTVSIEITDGTSSKNIILNSDLKSCEAVLINVKE